MYENALLTTVSIPGVAFNEMKLQIKLGGILKFPRTPWTLRKSSLFSFSEYSVLFLSIIDYEPNRLILKIH